jgi:hypothetical protein
LIGIGIGVVCLALSAAAYADTVTLTLDPNFGAPDYAFYTYTDIYGGTHSGLPVGPYIATLNGGGYNNVSVLVFCYDLNADTYVGRQYTGTVDPVEDLTAPSSTEVLESTFLINELMEDGGINATLATRGAISMAIWEIMNPTSTSASTPFPTDPAAIPYEDQAAAAAASGAWTTEDADLYPTWEPDDIASIQRFGMVPPPPTPEPPTVTLTSLGILALGLAKRRLKIPALKAAFRSLRSS